MADLNFYLPHIYNKEKQEFEVVMYTNLADNVFMKIDEEGTVKDIIEELQTDISNKADLDENGKIKTEQLPESLSTSIDIADYVSLNADNNLSTDEDGKLYVPPAGTTQNRDFIENPIDLNNEVTGILPIEHIDSSFLFSGDYDDLTNKPTITDGESAYDIWLSEGNTGTKEDFLDSLKGNPGEPGRTPEKGVDYFDGKSAYELAVDNGFEGNEEEWLESLTGAPGKSAYEIAVDNGFEGTEEEWLDSLNGSSGSGSQGNDGKSAYELAVDAGFEGTVEEWLESLIGNDGADGEPGKAATIEIGTVESIDPDTPTSVVNSGTVDAAILDFKIPKGKDGENGLTPHHGANGNWWIGDTDTEIPLSTPGETGIGIPSGGVAGQFLAKKSDDDFDTEWKGAQLSILVPFTITESAWQSSFKFAGFVFQADVPIEGLTENDYAQMILDANSVYLANKAFVMSGADVVGGAVRIYSKKKISETLSGRCHITKGAA